MAEFVGRKGRYKEVLFWRMCEIGTESIGRPYSMNILEGLVPSYQST